MDLNAYLREAKVLKELKRITYEEYDIADIIGNFLEIGKTIINAKDKSEFIFDSNNAGVIKNLLLWAMGDVAIKDMLLGSAKKGFNHDAHINKGIYITGPTGVGKTTLLDILNMFCRVNQIPVVRTDETGKNNSWIIRFQKYSAVEITREYKETGSIKSFLDIPFLYIDDLGEEPTKIYNRGNTTNALREIIEYRGDQGNQLTIFTSNISFTSKDFADLYGDRAQSRLYKMCNLYYLDGSDKRRL